MQRYHNGQFDEFDAEMREQISKLGGDPTEFDEEPFEAVKSSWKCRSRESCGLHGECKNLNEHKKPQSEFVQQTGTVNKSGVVQLVRPMDPSTVQCKYGAKCKVGQCNKAHPAAIKDVTPRCTRAVKSKDGKVEYIFQSEAECKRRSCHHYHKPTEIKPPEKQILKKNNRVHVRNLADRTKTQVRKLKWW
jgi:hypothetical protein